MDEMKAFAACLRTEEKSEATVKKYLRDVEGFLVFAAGRPLSKQLVLAYKQWLLEREYRPASINSMLASVNAWLRFTGREELRVRQLKLQRTIYCDMEKELTREEYAALVCTARAQNDDGWRAGRCGHGCRDEPRAPRCGRGSRPRGPSRQSDTKARPRRCRWPAARTTSTRAWEPSRSAGSGTRPAGNARRTGHSCARPAR